MWLFGGRASAEKKSAEKEENEFLRQQTEELQAKFDALRAAENREQMRLVPRSKLSETKEPSSFHSVCSDPGQVVTLEQLNSPSRKKLEKVQKQLTIREQKLTTASRTLEKTRSNNTILTAQLGLKELECSRISRQVEQLRDLLVEKEKRLQESLDVQETRNKQSQRSDTIPATAESEVLAQLSQLTEQLTDALEAERAAKEKVSKQLEQTLAKLRAEAAQRQIAEDRAVMLQEALELESARARSAQERIQRMVIEEKVNEVLSNKGKSFGFYHIEV